MNVRVFQDVNIGVEVEVGGVMVPATRSLSAGPQELDDALAQRLIDLGYAVKTSKAAVQAAQQDQASPAPVAETPKEG